MIDLSVSIIHMYHLAQTIACLRSVFSSTHRIGLEVFVVDNSCMAEDVRTITAAFPQARLISNTKRAGFSTNHNQALSQANGRYLCILNDDTIVHNGALDTLVAFMDQHPQAGACGSKLLRPDGSNQPAFSDFTNPIVELVIVPLLLRFFPQKWDVSNVTPTDWVSGACMVVRRAAADQAGLLDPQFDPAYAEERDWCYRIKQAGWDIFHVPLAQVTHLGGETTKYACEAMVVQLYRNKLLFYQKHSNTLATLQYRAVLFLLSCFRICGNGLLSCVLGRRDRSRQDLMVNWRVGQFALLGK